MAMDGSRASLYFLHVKKSAKLLSMGDIFDTSFPNILNVSVYIYIPRTQMTLVLIGV